ncbi:MAG: NAD(+) synthase [Bacteriovoracaceae bacterium]|nr:NAD(+) synthase [Bacteriovoracaceae bacterium]
MHLSLHQTHHTIGDFDSILSYLTTNFTNNEKVGLHIFPELFLTGYPLQDLCLERQFISTYLELLKKIDEWSTKAWKGDKNTAILMGGLHYEFEEDGLPRFIKNVVYFLTPGKPLSVVYTKQLLPNYDIFDELKYFSAGSECNVLEFGGKKIALMICEDMWPGISYNIDPTKQLQKFDLDVVINLSSSPYHLGKMQKRVSRGLEVHQALNAPFVYVNRVGGEDEILFDGSSFVIANNAKILQGPSFKSDILNLQLPKSNLPQASNAQAKVQQSTNIWSSLFAARLDSQKSPPTLHTLSDDDHEQLIQSLCFGIQEYARKCKMNKFLVALSGGMDSALVLALVKLSLIKGQTIEAVFMPGHFSAPISYDLSKQLAVNLHVHFHLLPIKFFHNVVKNGLQDAFGSELTGLADENIQSRLRGALIYARSNQTGAMVLNTSNKSELSVGYSTLYGDSVGALSVLGDLYKSEVYQLAKYINKKYNKIIPSEIITRPPSAELREGQADSDSLPPYDRLDAILEGILSYRLDKKHLVSLGFARKEIEKVYGLYEKSEYKRIQFCPIIKVKSKSFGFGHRIPICKKL